ncbi:acylphosphatase [Oceanobacillus caeni]
MGKYKPITLPQLPNEVTRNAKKTRLCAYSVALEGWRRGLKLKWYTKDSEHFQDMTVFGVNPPGRLYSLSSDTKTHYFFRSRGDKVTNEAVEIGSEKDDTKIWLEKANVPVPKGKGFEADASDEEIFEYCKALGYPLVLKPTNGSLGNGVVTDINNDEDLRKAIQYVRYELEYKEVIAEQFVAGKEYRVYVVGDQVIAAYNRVPANITGDGKHTIEQLIRLKNNQRKKNARLYSCLIEIDKEIFDFIQAAGYTFESVLPKGKQIFLRQKTNVSSGGDPIDVTDEMPDKYKQVAINALKAVPGLEHGGVDIIINEDSGLAVVIELNPTAQIGGALYPLEGKSRNIPAAIIDYYFPETKGIDTSNSKFYFDLPTVLEPLENRSAVEVEVKAYPKGEMYAKKYIVSGNVLRQSYHRWLKNQALDYNLHGHIKKLVNNDIEILIAGTNKDTVDQFKEIIKGSPNATVTNITEKSWTRPVKVGFEVSEVVKVSNLNSVSTALKSVEKELKRLTKRKDRVEKENRKIVASTSWRFTVPIRSVGSLMKKKS